MDMFISKIVELRDQIIEELAQLPKIWVVIRADWHRIPECPDHYCGDHPSGHFKDTLVGVFDSSEMAEKTAGEQVLERVAGCENPSCTECLSTVRIEMLDGNKVKEFFGRVMTDTELVPPPLDLSIMKWNL